MAIPPSSSAFVAKPTTDPSGILDSGLTWESEYWEFLTLPVAESVIECGEEMGRSVRMAPVGTVSTS